MENQKCFQEVGSTLEKSGRAPLHVAARYGESECLRILIEHGSDIEAKDKNKATPLALAAWKKHCNAVRQLIDAGAISQALNGNLHKTIAQCEAKEVPVKHRNTNGGTILIFCKIY